MAYSAGLFDKLFRNSGSYGTPVLVEVDEIEDLKIADSRNEIAGKLRKNDAVGYLVGQREISLEFKHALNPSSANWQALQTAYLGKSTIELFAFYLYIDNAGQPGTGSKALRATYQITEFPMDQPLEDMDSGDVVCKPSLNAANEPEIYTAA